MNELDGVLRVRMPQAMIDKLAREANLQMLTLSGYVRLALAQHIGMIEPPSVLVDTRAEYVTQEAE
jgi:hypothetical protein